MSIPAPCTRHARRVWLAYCPDCTAWHLAIQIARRDGLTSAAAPESGMTHSRPAAQTRRRSPQHHRRLNRLTKRHRVNTMQKGRESCVRIPARRI
jgi:hypothetical protein